MHSWMPLWAHQPSPQSSDPVCSSWGSLCQVISTAEGSHPRREQRSRWPSPCSVLVSPCVFACRICSRRIRIVSWVRWSLCGRTVCSHPTKAVKVGACCNRIPLIWIACPFLRWAWGCWIGCHESHTLKLVIKKASWIVVLCVCLSCSISSLAFESW